MLLVSLATNLNLPYASSLARGSSSRIVGVPLRVS